MHLNPTLLKLTTVYLEEINKLFYQIGEETVIK